MSTRAQANSNIETFSDHDKYQLVVNCQRGEFKDVGVGFCFMIQVSAFNKFIFVFNINK